MRTSTPGPQNPRFPYLLRDLAIDRVNQVWVADITYIPTARVRLAGRDHGLGVTPGARLAAVERHGS